MKGARPVGLFFFKSSTISQHANTSTGLVPANYLELAQEEEAPTHAEPAPTAAATATATAIYDYEAAEDNELSFPEGATITDIVSLLIRSVSGIYSSLFRNSQMKTGGRVLTTESKRCSQPRMWN
jgi:hypothetical protein